jgi:pimeloyl-ACP methyl ester carboxylesterase
MLEQSFPLPDGRLLGFAEYGDPQGKPVMLFHGQPGNRYFHPNEDQTKLVGVRLIVPDRPGYGLSSFQEGRKILDWPTDVSALADHLGIMKFDIIGYSAGGPYALACAYAIPDRIRKAVVVSGAPPMDDARVRKQMMPLLRINYMLSRHAKTLMRLVFWAYWKQARKKPQGFIDLMLKQAPMVDQQVMEFPGMMEKMQVVWEENLRVDSIGYVYDTELLMGNWGFDLGEIQLRVDCWWGRDDENAPPLVMDYLAQRLPNCTTNLVEDCGHFCLLEYWEKFLQGLQD